MLRWYEGFFFVCDIFTLIKVMLLCFRRVSFITRLCGYLLPLHFVKDAIKDTESWDKKNVSPAIVPSLLEALQEPTRKTTTCLEKLLQTKFVHFVDAPSLALIMPVISRAFQDRTTDTRKMAAQIMGNMYSLTDQKVCVFHCCELSGNKTSVGR